MEHLPSDSLAGREMISNTLWNRIVAAIESGGESSILELDSHADSPLVGSEALIIRILDRKFRVNGFTTALGSKTVDVVETAIAYECEFIGKVLIMVIRNGLHLKKMIAGCASSLLGAVYS